MQPAERVSGPEGGFPRYPPNNVVPFLRPEPGQDAGNIRVDRDARPAPASAEYVSRTQMALFVIASLVLHAGVYAAFRREAPPLASVGVQSISVEIVLGSNMAAGLAKTPTQSEESVDSTAAQGEGPELVKPETARAEKAVEDAPQVTADRAPAAVTPEAQVAEEKAATPPPVEAAQPPVARAVTQPPRRPRAVVRTATEPPLRRRGAAQRPKKEKGDNARTRESRASSASVASSGIGRGRSDTDTNYRGIVAAQLARNKHFPPDARRNGEEGRAVISFTIEPRGGVSRVALVRGTGVASLDREAQAMVQRAAPFPPTPAQQSMRFTVPVSFDLR